ncbi:MAG: hypothetical protein EAZ60_19425, partial [Oscillatoriales cyanobacterium]
MFAGDRLNRMLGCWLAVKLDLIFIKKRELKSMTQSSEFDAQQSIPQTDAEGELPQPNERGEYKRTSHRYWEATNSGSALKERIERI